MPTPIYAERCPSCGKERDAYHRGSLRGVKLMCRIFSCFDCGHEWVTIESMEKPETVRATKPIPLRRAEAVVLERSRN